MANPNIQETGPDMAAWYGATVLAERQTLLCTQPATSMDTTLAHQRLARWRAQRPFDRDTYFSDRLALNQLDEGTFRYLLGQSAETLRHHHTSTPDWLKKIHRAFADYPTSRLFTTPTPSDNLLPFLAIIEPLILDSLKKLQGVCWFLNRLWPKRPFSYTVIQPIFLTNLTQQLLPMLERTLLLELNITRLQGQLVGTSPQARFNHFCQRLQNREVALAILQAYPVLARQLQLKIEQWLKFSSQFWQHLLADWSLICKTFNQGQSPGPVVSLETAGDQHANGKCVLIVTFATGFKLVYKPKPTAVEVHFQSLLTWLNERGSHPPFRTLTILDRESYGWVEFVAHAPCHSAEAVQRFYTRQGAYLALFYALEATDFHYENLIASGEHPVFVDLESLFHPDVADTPTTLSDTLIIDTLTYSVLRVGLLPHTSNSGIEADNVDISGLGFTGGSLTPYAVSTLPDQVTDDMKIMSQKIPMPQGKHRPHLPHQAVNLVDYTDTIVAGFTEMYRLLLTHREALLAADGPLSCFATDAVRAILRPTEIYARLGRESFHPDVLQDALERERLFDRLWVQVEHRPHLQQVITSEQTALWRGDIPLFTTRPNSCDLWSCTGQHIPDFFEQSSLDLVFDHIRQLDEADLARQAWFVRASLSTTGIQAGHSSWRGYEPTPATAPVTSEQLLQEACAIGDKLAEIALQPDSQGRTSWIGLTFLNESQWKLMPVSLDLYSGISGITLFLAYLHRITGQRAYRQLAQSALLTMQQMIIEHNSVIQQIGPFNGWGGAIYTLTHLGVLWQDASLLQQAESLAALLPSYIHQDREYDVISGSAGCIRVLLGLYQVTHSTAVLETAVQCGEHLLAQAQPMTHGIGWLSDRPGEKMPLVGFSHGAAGIANALLHLAQVTGDSRFHTAAQAAITYERSFFSDKHQNWPDLRQEGEEAFMCAWCHGAPGVGLARFDTWSFYHDAEMEEEVNTALQTTKAQGFGLNHSLCHGDLGNVELLIQASQHLAQPTWQQRLQKAAATILTSITQHGYLCGVPLGVETPGLMTGLAGIGYGLLRLAHPTLVPSVLVMAPPIMAQTRP